MYVYKIYIRLSAGSYMFVSYFHLPLLCFFTYEVEVVERYNQKYKKLYCIPNHSIFHTYG